MTNLILPTESNQRIYSKFHAYEEANLIKLAFWYTPVLESIFTSENFEIVIDNYIEQASKEESINHDFKIEDGIDFKDFLLSLNQEEFTNEIIRTAYKMAKKDVEIYDEMEDDEL